MLIPVTWARPRTHIPVLSEAIDISLDVSSIVLTTLRGASKIAPLPLLSTAAGIAVDIIGLVQRVRQNKNGFKRLAEDSCELVYVIVLAHKDISNAEDVPHGLTRNLQQLVKTLASIHEFAARGASRNYFQAIFRSGVDAKKVHDYREKLQQSMRVFGLQSDISLRQTVAELASRQIEMMNELKNRPSPDPISPSGESVDSASTPASPSVNSEAGVKMIIPEVSESCANTVVIGSALSKRNVTTMGVIFVGVAISLFIRRIQGR